MLNYKSLKNLLILLVVTLVLTYAGSAQTTTATLSGSVNDEKDAAVPGATVKVINTDAGFERTVTTSSNGTFTVPLLPPATYRVIVEREGFATFEASGITLNANDQKAVSINLKVGSVGVSVQVTSDAPLIDESPAVSTTVDRTFVNNLPTNGRSIQSLIALSPGVVAVPVASDSQGQFSVNGQRANSNYFTVDGVSGNFSIPVFAGFGQNASGSLPASTTQGGFQNLASIDALQEFSIQTSTFAPEFGRGPGAQVSLVTRSGENKYHGSLFEYFRNDIFDARDFFDTVKPALRYNNFGGTFSGPVLLPRFGEGGPALWKGKDKTFFFFSYEGQRFIVPQPAVSIIVPSLAARQTNIFTGAPANDVARAILNAFPLPNGPEIRNASGQLTGGANYSGSFSNPQRSDAWGLRIDHNFTKNITLFGRFNYSPSKSKSRYTTNPSAFFTSEQPSRKLYFGSTQVFGTNLVNEIRVDFSQQKGTRNNGFDGFGGGVRPPDSIFLPDGVGTRRTYTLFPVTNVFDSYVLGQGADSENKQFQIINNLSYRIGSHQLKFGGDYRRLTPTAGPNDLSISVLSGTLQNVYNNVTTRVIAAKSAIYTALFNSSYFYGQDTWKTTKNLTITYGLGWNINPSPTAIDGKKPYTLVTPPDLSVLDQSSLALAPLGTPYFKTDYKRFTPRFGFSYQVNQVSGRELVVRGGIGVFYDLGQTGFGSANFPYANNINLLNAQLPVNGSLIVIPDRSLTLSSTNRATVTVAAKDYTLPRTYQWNLTAEQSLGTNQTLSVGYVGALGRKLVRVQSLNIGLPGQFAGTYFSSSFSNVILIDNGADSDYHSLQAQFTRRLTKGFQALASYTWSHSIDNSSSDQAVSSGGYIFPQNVYRSDSSFDVRHNFSTALTYVIPTPKWNKISSSVFGGWSLNGIFLARTGLPFTVLFQESTPIGTFGNFRRPNLTGQPIYLNDTNVATGRRLNPAAFNTALPIGQMGNLGRNSLRGPGFYQIDMGIHRTFNLNEKLNMQVRWEVFNVLNHSNFLYPTSVIGVAPFGVITQTAARGFGGGSLSGGFNPLFQNGGPRSMQFAFRMNF